MTLNAVSDQVTYLLFFEWQADRRKFEATKVFLFAQFVLNSPLWLTIDKLLNFQKYATFKMFCSMFCGSWDRNFNIG